MAKDDQTGGDHPGQTPKPTRTEIRGDQVLGNKTEQHYHPAPMPGGRAPWQPSSAVQAYIDWLGKQQFQARLRGVGGDDISLDLSELYIPLKFSLRTGKTPTKFGGPSDHERPFEGQDFAITDLFVRLRGQRFQHALLLGDPGSGKTTALRKLSQIVRDQAMRACAQTTSSPLPAPQPAPSDKSTQLVADSLSPKTLPIFIPLREWNHSPHPGTLKKFVTRILLKDKAVADEGSAAALWEHRHLLLLLDGLDEITEPNAREKFCKFLSHQLQTHSGDPLHVIVSCRFAGYDDHRGQIRLVSDKNKLGRVELSPLSLEQAEQLIIRWFTEVANKGHLEHEIAQERATHLSKALKDPRFADPRRAMYATPLILNLLCVIYRRGSILPESRAEFYETCLAMLLKGWQSAKTDDKPGATAPALGKPLLPGKDALALLRPLALRLHSNAGSNTDEETREQIHREILLNILGEGLEGLSQAYNSNGQTLRWLDETCGVLKELAPGHFGFFHLGIQEYLTAVQIARLGEKELHTLADHLDNSWWHEVILLAGSLPQHRAFAPLMRRLLQVADLSDENQWKLLRNCVLEAAFDPTPFVERLSAETLDKAPRLLALLRLIQDQPHPQLLDALRTLAKRPDVDPGVLGTANQLVCKHSRTAPANRTYDVAIVSLEDAEPQAQQLLQKLRLVDSLRVWPRTGESPLLRRMSDFAQDDSPAKDSPKAAATIILVVHTCLLWAGKETLLWSRLKNFLGGKKNFLAIFAPGGGATPGEPPRKMKQLDMRKGWQIDTLCRLLQPSQDPTIDTSAGGKPTLIARLHTPTIEKTIGLRLLWVPGGTFIMGSDELNSDSRPAHLVKLSPFWIGETPVTNQQYRVFVEATGHRQPRAWRDRRFNDPQQPVVTVSWADAVAFCKWLSKECGWAVRLPSEAQWEFAARGEDGRTYPWGNELPDATRAHFGQGNGAPALVGSYPAGRGPFGTLDQAGNVWEWCADVWDPEIYDRRPRPPAVKVDPPVHSGGESDRHAIRGGSWWDDRGALAAAYRNWDWRVSVDAGVSGFRVVVAREPVDL